MSVTAFKCPCCGAELTFSSEAQKMACEYCGTELDVEAVSELSRNEQSSDDMDWSTSSQSTVGLDGDICTYTCNSCGAEITGDRSLGATSCPYCGSPFVVNEKFNGILKPDYVIPFKVGKEKAVEQFKAFCKHRPLLPGNFMSSHKIESIQGMYVPYWLFDCKAKAHYRFRAQRITSWTEGDYNVTRTDHYMLVRDGSMKFDNVPVDGTSKLQGEITESIEPFDISDTQSFNPAYLSGYLADRYDVSAEDSKPRADQRIKESVEFKFKETAEEYTAITVENSNISLENGEIHYALMPMWLMTAKYGDKLYTFAMNGQTGRFVGELPVSLGRIWAILIGVSAASSIILALILGALGL